MNEIAIIDCASEMPITIDGYFNITNMNATSRGGKAYCELWYYIIEFFQDYEKDPDPIILHNVLINGSKYNF